MTTNGREPIPPAKRRRLQQMYEHATKAVEQENFDYAARLLTDCVVGDPANAIYTQQFLFTLSRKYNNSPKNVGKLANIKAAGSKTGLKKSSMQKDWPSVIKSGLEILKGNPWDISTLMQMAQACEELQCAESQLKYLKMALDVNVKDADVNRSCGRALARMGHFDQAITCWHRVEQAKPGDEEAQRAIADLAVERTISRGGYEEAESSTDVKKIDNTRDDDVQLTPEQKLEKLIAKNPGEVPYYVELADIHIRNDRMPEAEAVLGKALEVSGGDISLRERLEDVQLRRHRTQVAVAERRAEQDKTEEAQALAKKMKGELNRVELEIYRSRADRNPTNLSLKYELGIRLKRAGKYQDAIQALQVARGDSKRKASVYLELGECFQFLKVYQLAMNNYEAALAEIPERDTDMQKQALYRAGKLALYMAMQEPGKWLDVADKHLSALASLDFVYKDVPALLDKVAQMRNKG